MSLFRTLFQNRAAARPLFAIIIPAFRSAGKLERSIVSVLRERRDLFELIVVDGGSQDGTPDILKRFEPQLRWISEPDDGVYHAMNKGIAMSTAPYLYFLGAGDTLREGVLCRVAPHMPPRAIGFLYGDVFMLDKNIVWDGEWTAEKFRTRTPCQQAIFYDRRIFDRQGLFEHRFKTMADYAMNIRCFGDPKIRKIYIDEIICDYEGAGYSATFRDELFHSERPAMLKTHLNLDPKKKKA